MPSSDHFSSESASEPRQFRQCMLPLANELVVDNFAGGGGASVGIERGIGRPIDIAVNHDASAINMHKANHPHTHHYQESIWDVDPRAVCHGPVGLAWFSPDCTHFSRARGAVPIRKEIRGLAWVVLRWAALVKPRVCIIENVCEIASWGQLTRKRGRKNHPRPCRFRKGKTFQRWLAQLQALGYKTEYRELMACDYGAPTIRKRLFVIARRDGLPIRWPEPTHGPGRIPFRTASECIDWSLPCPSIFERKRPLAEATLKRIATGMKRYVFDTADPFLVPVAHGGRTNRAYTLGQPIGTLTTSGQFALVQPTLRDVDGTHVEPVHTDSTQALLAQFLAKHFGGMVGVRVDTPMPTITSKASQTQLVTSHLVHLRRNASGRSMTDPLPTLTTANHVGEVRAFLVKYYGTAIGQSLQEPLHSATSKARFGLVTIAGEDYQVVDIGMRMLQPHELFAAQGFPRDYIIDAGADGVAFTKTAKIKLCGNSVCPQWAEALVRENFGHEARMAA